MDTTVSAHVESHAGVPDNQQDPGLETERGIMESVSPELPGFTGIPKKRYDASEKMISLIVDILIIQVHRFSSQ